MKVLIAENNLVSQNTMKKILDNQGYEVITADDGWQAWELLQKNDIQIVMTDWMMPKMDGLSFLAKLMQHYPMPVVVFSSFEVKDGEIALEAMDLGAVEVLCKPGEESAKNVYGNLAKSIQIAGLTQIIKNNQKSPSLV